MGESPLSKWGGYNMLSAAEEAADAIALRVGMEQPTGFAGITIHGDTVVLRWAGEPSVALQRFVDTLGVEVRFESATFSQEQLLLVAERLITRFPDVISSAGMADDASGIQVTLLPPAAADAEARGRAVERLRDFVGTSPDSPPVTVTGVSGPFQYPEEGMGLVVPRRLLPS